MKTKIFSALLLVLLLSVSSFAQSDTQTSFTIAPPPLGYPEYPEEAAVSNTVNFTGAFISGDGISINGFFAGWIPRYGADWIALNALLGMFVMSGDVDLSYGRQPLSIVGFNFAPSVEMPVIQSSFLMIIIFGGYDFSYSRTSFATTDPYSSGNKLTWYISTAQYGPLAGMQVHFIIADTVYISPFFMVKSMKGSVSITTDPAYEGFQTTDNMPSYTASTYGFDILEKNTGVTLSGMLQMAGKTKDTEEIKTYIFGASMKI